MLNRSLKELINSSLLVLLHCFLHHFVCITLLKVNCLTYYCLPSFAYLILFSSWDSLIVPFPFQYSHACSMRVYIRIMSKFLDDVDDKFFQFFKVVASHGSSTIRKWNMKNRGKEQLKKIYKIQNKEAQNCQYVWGKRKCIQMRSKSWCGFGCSRRIFKSILCWSSIGAIWNYKIFAEEWRLCLNDLGIYTNWRVWT